MFRSSFFRRVEQSRALWWRAATVVGSLALAVSSQAQSLNIDLDVFFGDPSNGNGQPPPSFGAASDQLGAWNRILAGSAAPEQLIGLDGALTSVVMRADRTTIGGGSNLPINEGSYALLLNDYAVIPEQLAFSFSGLMPGEYNVWTYAVSAIGDTWPVHVSVDNSSDPTQTITGPMPGNSFELLVTHSIHRVAIQTNEIVIRLASPWPRGHVNGFQIVRTVPEPATLLILSIGAAITVRRRCRQ